ncbi:MAG: dienelactone hydrolase family protein [Porticoccaceae bacterium]
MNHREVRVEVGDALLDGALAVAVAGAGLVIFAHGSGSGRLSPRNLQVAGVLNRAGLSTLLFDLLTPDEQALDERTGALRFDIDLLSARLVGVIDWVQRQEAIAGLRIGLFGASTGAAAALGAAAERPGSVAAVVSRGGRPDLALASLPAVMAPTLLIVGGEDGVVIELNRKAAARLRAPHRLEIVPGATHLFPEPGALERVAELTRDWFVEHLAP